MTYGVCCNFDGKGGFEYIAGVQAIHYVTVPPLASVSYCCDNVLKPMMLGRGLEVPMPIILVGVIGGMVVDGLLGLFVGPVLLAVGYVLLMEWLRYGPPPRRAAH